MNRLASVVVAAVVAAGFALAPASPAAAAPPKIQITKVYYDSPGKDTGSKSSLNAEWVRLTNRRTYTINLEGWTLRDRAGHVYTFNNTFKLRPGKHVWIHTGNGKNTSKHRYWRQSWYVWNNTGDRAVLTNRHGKRIDTCSWGDGSGITYCK